MRQPTMFQILASAVRRAKQGLETPDDLVLFLRHPEMTAVMFRSLS
jgi:hypothetical protein